MATFSHILYIKKRNTYVSGPVPIYLRITVNGKRSEISINRKVEPEKWNSAGAKMKGSTEEVKKFNSYLDTLTSKLTDAYHDLVRTNCVITAETLKNKYTGKSEIQRMLIPIFQMHNDDIAKLTDEFSVSTVKKYGTSLSHTKEFIKYKYKITDIAIKDINHQFVSDYDFWLRSEKKCSNNSTVKYIRNFKKIIRICLNNEWLDKDPFTKYKGKVKEIERCFLSEEELEIISEKTFKIQRIIQVKDIFLFSCYTGLAYADVKKLETNNVSVGIDGQKWIFVNRTKNGNPSRIPLLPVALEILEKYKNNPKCLNENILLPVLSNQKMNSYLKEIADVCEINKEITFHIARHTFATTITLNNNVPLESVSKMLGHKNIRTTQHYAKLLDKKVGNDMKALYLKFSGQKTKDEEKAIAN